MEEELDLLDLFFTFWNKKVWLILAIILGIAGGFLYTKFIVTPQYSSSVTLILAKAESSSSTYQSDDAITQSDIALNQKLISTYSEIMKSKRVGKAVIDNLGLDITYDELIKGVSVTSVKDTDVIKVSVTSKDPEMSQKIVTEMIEIFTDEVDRVYNIKNVSIIDEGEINRKPININYTKNIVIFAAIAFIIVAGIIFIIYYFDNTIKSSEMVGKVADLPVLATIPKVNPKNGGSKNNG